MASNFRRTISRKEQIIRQLQADKDLKNPEDIANQIIQKRPIIKFSYKNDTLHVNNEAAALYHMLNSIKKIEKMVDAIEQDECRTVLDIGANTGLFAYFVKKRFPNAHIYLFEPDERLWPIIIRNMSTYDDYEIIKDAVSNTDDDEVDFFINSNSAQTNSLVKDAVTSISDDKFIIKHKVKTIKLDSFCLSRNLYVIDILKIDIQGGELNAFYGGLETLRNTHTLFAEASFFVNDTVETLNFLKRYFSCFTPINSVYMGADLKFYNKVNVK